MFGISDLICIQLLFNSSETTSAFTDLSFSMGITTGSTKQSFSTFCICAICPVVNKLFNSFST